MIFDEQALVYVHRTALMIGTSYTLHALSQKSNSLPPVGPPLLVQLVGKLV